MIKTPQLDAEALEIIRGASSFQIRHRNTNRRLTHNGGRLYWTAKEKEASDFSYTMQDVYTDLATAVPTDTVLDELLA